MYIRAFRIILLGKIGCIILRWVVRSIDVLLKISKLLILLRPSCQVPIIQKVLRLVADQFYQKLTRLMNLMIEDDVELT